MMASANVLDLKAQGAPVDFVIPRGGAGQAAVNHRYGSVLKNVPEAFYVPLRSQKLSNLTPQKITAYQHYWDSLFR